MYYLFLISLIKVEKYNRDIYEVMLANSAAVQPDFKTSSHKSASRRRAEQQQQQQQQQQEPDVDEARLTQMRKMYETKTLLPEAEAAYYDGVSFSFGMGEVKLGGLLQK